MRIAMGIEYNGSQYFGWQRLSDHVSVQQTLESALSIVANHPVNVSCAGRTDSGVHAQAQVIHFNTDSERENHGWLLGTNAHLPDDISVIWVQPVSEEFHARFSATARAYRYVIINRLASPAILQPQASWIHYDLDHERMHEAAQLLLGENDYNAYRAVGCQSKSSIRIVEYINVSRCGEYIYVDIKADAFLHHMVRNIVGVLLAIGSGEQEIGWSLEVLKTLDRTKAGVTAPANGLYMVAVDYPEQFNLPEPPRCIQFSAE